MSNHDDWEREMSRELDARVRDLHDAPFTLDEVKGRATTIRRNRRLAVAGGILATAAVVVPVAVVASQGLPGSDTAPAIPAATGTPSEATDTANPLPVTEGLGVDYLEGSTWVRPDGTRLELGTAYLGGTTLGTDLLAVRNDDDTGEHFFDVIDGSGTVTESVAFVSGLAVNDARSTVAYVSPEGELMTLWDPDTGTDGRVSMGSGFTADVSPVAVLGGPSCYEAVDGCTVLINHGDGQTPPESVSSHGITDQVVGTDPVPLKATDASVEALVTLQTSSSDTGSCNGLFAMGTGDYLWETCERYLLDLSPSGDHVAATDAYLDGIGLGHVAIVDTATQEELVRLDPADGFVSTQVWESDTTLLASVYDGGAWSIWRLGVDGSTELVVGPSTEGDDLTPAFTLLRGY